mmetsp:Transcript_38240/g.89422  ORF Transcript_38240/g.89422 Transcript_38240/m.89422 type:complete len:204 (+) Transcript_38240:1125-1736(+)
MVSGWRSSHATDFARRLVSHQINLDLQRPTIQRLHLREQASIFENQLVLVFQCRAATQQFMPFQRGVRIAIPFHQRGHPNLHRPDKVLSNLLVLIEHLDDQKPVLRHALEQELLCVLWVLSSGWLGTKGCVSKGRQNVRTLGVCVLRVSRAPSSGERCGEISSANNGQLKNERVLCHHLLGRLRCTDVVLILLQHASQRLLFS